MSVWLDKPRHRPDGRHKASGRTTVRSAFQNFVQILSWFEPRPDGHTSAARNFHIKASCVRTKGMVIRTVDQMHAISIYVARASGPWMLSSGRLNFECATCLMDERVQTVAAIFPYLCFGKKSHSWSNTEWRPDNIATSSGRMHFAVLSQTTKNKTFTSENICSSASKGRSHREYLA